MKELILSLWQRRWWPVWRRHALVWRKLAGPALLGNIGEPLLYLLALGYGLGAMIGSVNGVDYLTFLAAGFICASAMNTATFEATYSAYTRMAVQESWLSMLHAPLDLADVLLGEILWAASKSLLSATLILLIAAILGAIDSWLALAALPVVFLLGCCFAALGLVITTLARNYDFFLYYFTLAITPMLLLSGVFFPLEELAPPIRDLANLLPLSHAIILIRPLVTGDLPSSIALPLAVISGYTITALLLAHWLARRRLIQ
jgi:lipooligosaccharide transport system permease protein